jgi:TRAP-type C4-dicarboxylate transport system substrate-binding protein
MITKRLNRTGAIALAAGFAATALLTSAASAQENIKLTFITGFPPFSTFVSAFTEGYAPAVDTALAKTGNYKIEWNMAHSGQIVKPRGELEGVELGLGDIGDVTTPFHLDRVPLYKLAYVTPFTTKDPAVLTDVHATLQNKFPQFDQSWRAINQLQVGMTTVVDNYLLLSSTPIKKLSDIKGKKIGAAGPNLPWVTPIGAAGVQADLVTAYNALQTGIYSGMIIWMQVSGAFKLCDPAPYALDAGLGAASIHSLNFNQDKWNSLPDEVKQALKGAGGAWNKMQIDRLVGGTAAMRQRCEKDFGLKYTLMDPKERLDWAKSMPNLAKQWAKSMNDKGLPGSQILSMYMDEMRAAKQPLARHWDRE